MSGNREEFCTERDDIRPMNQTPVSGSSPVQVLNADKGKIAGRIVPDSEEENVTRSHNLKDKTEKDDLPTGITAVNQLSAISAFNSRILNSNHIPLRNLIDLFTLLHHQSD